MPKALKFALLALAAVGGTLAIAGAIIAFTFDPNDTKPLLIERMQREYRRTLVIPGDVGLRFFPNVGVQLGIVSLSEPDSPALFASVQSARVSLALLPLLRNRMVIDRVQVQGLRATLTRHKDGRSSIDDLLRPPQTKGEEPAEQPAMTFDIAGLCLSDAALTVDDKLEGRRFELTKVEIESGRMAPGTAGDAGFRGHLEATRPQLGADFAVKGSFLLDPLRRHCAFGNLSAELTGRVATAASARRRWQDRHRRAGRRALRGPHDGPVVARDRTRSARPRSKAAATSCST